MLQYSQSNAMSENIRCFVFPDGTPGFYASGNVLLECSPHTCGDAGKAEIWCMVCCQQAMSTPQALVNSLMKSYSPKPSSDNRFIKSNGELSTDKIACIILASIMILAILFIIAWRYHKKRFASRKAGNQPLDVHQEERLGETAVNLESDANLPFGEEEQGLITYGRHNSTSGS